jgi:hypothetical protein
LPIKLIFPLLFGLLLMASVTIQARADSVWQYSVRVGQDPLRRAYLWVPPNTKRIRGVILGVQNMLEEPMFEDDTIRKAAADCGLAIVWLSPRDDFEDKAQQFRTFNPPQETAQAVLQILAALAKESGYTEIADAPLLVTAHSASTPFVYGIAATIPQRIVAIFPYKGWIQDMTPGIPTMHVTSEYAEVGGADWGEVWRKDTASSMKQRMKGDDYLVGEFAEIGNGHYEWNPEVAPVIAMFIRKAVQYRLPAVTPRYGPPTLKTIDPKSGWLLDPMTFGTPADKPIPETQWQGDPTKALWYFDKEMAQTVNDYMAAGLAKKPQVIDFVGLDGKPLPLDKGGNPTLPFQIMSDGADFKVAATFLDRAPAQIYGGAGVGHAAGPILFKVSSGALKQTGPDTFRVWMRRGGLIQQGSPWEPWIMAYQPGNDEYRRADRPGHPYVYTINRDGKLQLIDFARIGDQRLGVKSLTLHAISDAGLPVQFYVISGPVRLKDDNRTLEFLPIPPRSKFPVRVVIGAYQWGRITDSKVQTGGPIVQQFWITR